MDKLGVEIDKKKEAEAEKSGKCPECGAVLVNFNPPRCKNCGTKPFEAVGTVSGRRSSKDMAIANEPRHDFDLGGES